MYNFSIKVNDKNDERLGFKNIEVNDSYFKTPLYKMGANELEDECDALIESFTKIVIFESVIPVCDYEAYKALYSNAHILKIENIKVDVSALGAPVDFEALKKIIALGEAYSIKTVFEVTAERFEEFNYDTYMQIRTGATGVIYNPIEFVKLHKNPFLSSLYKAKYKDDVVALRICDMLYDTLIPTHIEKGHSEVKECASCLLARSYKGYFSFYKYGDDIDVKDAAKEFAFALQNM